MTAAGLVLLLAGLVAALSEEVVAVRREVVMPRRLRLSDIVVLLALTLLIPRLVEILT
jgi:hypothetical protein